MEKFKVFFALVISTLLIWSMTGITDYNEYTESYQYDSKSASSKQDNKMLESVVLIESMIEVFGGAIPKGAATGFAVHYDKKENATYLISNNHVCNVQPNEILYFSTSQEKVSDNLIAPNHDLEIIDTDPKNDLCLLKARDIKITPVSFKPSSSLGRMDAVSSIGAPSGIFPIWIDGRFSGYIDREDIHEQFASEDEQSFMLISSIIVPGQSGSPVYDENGRVVGVIFATLGNYGGLAIPSESVIKFIKEIL